MRSLRGLLTTLLAVAGLASGAQASPSPVTVAFLTFSPPPRDLELVNQELSRLVEGRIGAPVKLLPIHVGAWGQQINLMLASGKPLDLMVDGTINTFSLGSHVAKNQLLPLDDLLAQEGQGILASVPASFLQAGRIRGKQYLVPTIRDFAGDYQFLMRQDVVQELGIDPASIRTVDEVTSVLRLVKQKRPDLIPLVPQTSGTSILDGMQTYDRLGGSVGVLPNFGAALVVKNLFELPEYAADLRRIRSWYQAGYILKDAATSKVDFTSYFREKRAFSFLAQGKPGFAGQESSMAGVPLVSVTLVPAFSTTDNVLTFGWAIPRTTGNASRAMKFLNLLYTDSQVFNLLVFGLEGKHYRRTGPNTVAAPVGVDQTNAAYGFGTMSWQFGNQFLGYLTEGDPPDLWEKVAEFSARATKSKALGFVFDPTPVKNEIAACQTILNLYRLGLEDGVLDPAPALAEMNAQLRAAGASRIVAEKQRQLDSWVRQEEAPKRSPSPSPDSALY